MPFCIRKFCIPHPCTCILYTNGRTEEITAATTTFDRRFFSARHGNFKKRLAWPGKPRRRRQMAAADRKLNKKHVPKVPWGVKGQ
jgi:hypothetical protein